MRTNSIYDSNSLQFDPPHFTVYDPTHKQFFVSNPYLNEIDVFDAVQELQTAAIPVPTAWGIDISPTNGNLYAGTLIGDVYQIDTTALKVVKRYPAASIGANGFRATTALVLADGRLALQGAAGGILGIDGFGAPVVWDPGTNELDSGINGAGVCPTGSNGSFVLSGDRTRILVTTVDLPASIPVCSYDPATKVATYGYWSTRDGSPVREIVPTPDGKRFFLLSNIDGVAVFDAKTVQLLGEFGDNGNYDLLPNGADAGVVSLDGKTLYLVNGGSSGLIAAYDTTTFAQTGYVPSLFLEGMQNVVIISAIDETGLLVGPIAQGVAFLDASRLQGGSPSIIQPGIAKNPTGPLSGGTTTNTFYSTMTPTSPSLTTMYVGNIPGENPIFAAGQGFSLNAQVTTPQSSLAGPVDFTAVLNDGGVGIMPEAFSYGPTILQILTNSSTADGGQSGSIVGFGFGKSPSDIQVSIGGRQATVTALPPILSTSYPLNAVQFAVPAGTAGSTDDVTVTTQYGSATAKSAFHYIPPPESYPLVANLQSGVYDAQRDLYFFADTNKIQVLSRSSKSWLTPITLPGLTSKTQLTAIAESPDRSKLAVSDTGDQAVYVVDPDDPASVNRYAMPLDPYSNTPLSPLGIAITNAGDLYIATEGAPEIIKLDGSGSYSGTSWSGNSPSTSQGQYQRIQMSPDGSRVYAASLDSWIDTTTGQMSSPFNPSDHIPGAYPYLEISGDGATVDAYGQFADSSLNTENSIAYNTWEPGFITPVHAEALNHDGTLLYQGLENGIDVIARNSGRLLYRVQTSFTPASVFDPFVTAPNENALAVITSSGVEFLDLSSLPIPASDSQPFPAVAHH